LIATAAGASARRSRRRSFRPESENAVADAPAATPYRVAAPQAGEEQDVERKPLGRSDWPARFELRNLVVGPAIAPFRFQRHVWTAANAIIFGADAPLADHRHKASLGTQTGAVAVDMESHIAARLAARHGAPLAAVRIISDPVERSLPHAAIAGMRPDGKADIPAVLRSLWRKPRQLPPLLRTALDARLAFASLRQCRPSLGDDFCFYA